MVNARIHSLKNMGRRSRELEHRLALTNGMAAVYALCLVPITFLVSLYIGPTVALVLGIECLFFIVVLLLGFFGYPSVSRFVLVLVINLATFVLDGLLGRESYIFLNYFIVLIAPLVLIKTDEVLLLCSALAVSITFLMADLIFDFNPIPQLFKEVALTELIQLITLPTTAVSLLALVVGLVRENELSLRAVKQQQQQLETVVTSLNDVIFEVDASYNIVNVWTSDESMLPLSSDFYENLPPKKFLPADLFNQFAKAVDQVLDTGQPEQFVYRSPFKGKWYEARIVKIQTPQEQKPRVSISLHDISAEKVERERAEIQNQIVDKHLNAIIFTDLKGRIRFANEAAYSVYGAHGHELAGTSMRVFDHPEGVSTESILSLADDENGWRSELLAKRLDGTEFYARLTVFRIFADDGHLTGFTWSCRDISDNKDAERLLKLNERRFRSMTENAPGVVVEWTTTPDLSDFSFKYVSPKVVEVMGLTPEAFLQNPSYLLNLMGEADQQHFKSTLWEAVNFDRRWEFKVKVRLPHQGERWIRGILTPIDKQSSSIIFHGILMDITAEQNYREALLNAKNEAESATREKSEFLSVMSHEIRTPLNALIGLSHLLLHENPRDDQVENLKTLKFSAESLLSLINDILDFSKIEAGKINLEIIPFDLKGMVESLSASMAYQAEEKGISLKCKVDPTIPHVLMGDPTRLAQILTNLLSNAVKFTRQGGVDLSIQMRGRREGRVRLQVRVSDTGVGIAKEKQSEIFNFFSQADSSVTREFGGTGLGLAITKSLLKLFGSEIVLRSQPGEGSTFLFELELAEANKRTLSEYGVSIDASATEPDLTGANILLVDDNRVNVMVAMKLLSKWGAHVDTAEDGQQAYEKVQTEQYDVVLMDIQMPGMDGYEATRAIRALKEPQYQSLPIIALTATVMDEVREKAKVVGMNSILSKPIRPSELQSSIRNYLGTKQSPLTAQNVNVE